jgi:hypothetical protein
MSKKFRSEEVQATGVYVHEVIDGPSSCGVPLAKISGLQACDINLEGYISGHATGHFESLVIAGVPYGLTEMHKNLYGFWFSGCDTSHLYLDIGTGEEVGLNPHEHHASGYASYMFDVSGVNIHITGRNESGLLTFEYPEPNNS